MIISPPIGTQPCAILNTWLCLSQSQWLTLKAHVVPCLLLPVRNPPILHLSNPCPPSNYPKLAQTFIFLVIIDFLVHIINSKAIKTTLTFSVAYAVPFSHSSQSHVGVCCYSSCCWFSRLSEIQSWLNSERVDRAYIVLQPSLLALRCAIRSGKLPILLDLASLSNPDTLFSSSTSPLLNPKTVSRGTVCQPTTRIS